MPRETLRGFARVLSVSPSHVHRLIVRGVIERGADGLIDVDAARASIDASKSVAHGYLAEVNERQRAAHRAPSVAPPPPEASAPAAAPPRGREKNRKSPRVVVAELPAPIDPGPAPDPAAMAAATANRRAYDAARSDRERAAADLTRLEYQRKAGMLVARDVAERVLFECARRARDAFMQFPSRAAPEIASAVGVADAEPLRQAIADHVTRLLEQLGSQPLDFDDPDA